MSELTIGVDIGGTKVAAALVDSGGQVMARAYRSTPNRSVTPSVVEETLVAAISELRAQATTEPKSIGIGAAGFVDSATGIVHFAPHLSWRKEPLEQRLRERVGLPVCVDNDANVALLAEQTLGAARGHQHVILVNLGTGIGGAILASGEIYRGRYGLAGEFGHMQVVPAGVRCECGNRGCWEKYSSGQALEAHARLLAHDNAPIAAQLVRSVGGEIDLITGPAISAAAAQGDPLCSDLLREVGQWLGVGLANLAAAFDPEIFVIGGGVSAAGDLLLEPARQAFSAALPGRGYRPKVPIVPSALGVEAGMIGAAVLAGQHWSESTQPDRNAGPRQ